jgi:hypothetical protein
MHSIIVLPPFAEVSTTAASLAMVRYRSTIVAGCTRPGFFS